MYKHLNNIKHIIGAELMTSNHLKSTTFQFKLAERKKPLAIKSNFTLFLLFLISFWYNNCGENGIVGGHVNTTNPNHFGYHP